MSKRPKQSVTSDDNTASPFSGTRSEKSVRELQRQQLDTLSTSYIELLSKQVSSEDVKKLENLFDEYKRQIDNLNASPFVAASLDGNSMIIKNNIEIADVGPIEIESISEESIKRLQNAANEITRKINETNQQKRLLEQELGSLKNEYHQQILNLQSELSNVTNAQEFLMNENNALKLELQQLHNINGKLNHDLKVSEEEKKQLEEVWEKQGQEFEKNMNLFSAEDKNRNLKMRELETELENVKRLNAKLQKENNNLQSTIDDFIELEENVKTLENENRELRITLKKSTAENDALKRKMESLEISNANLNNKLDQIQRRNSGKDISIRSLEQEKQQLTEKIHELQINISDLEGKRNKSESTILELSAKIEEILNEKEDLEGKKIELQRELEEVNEKRTELQRKLQNKDTNLKNTENEVKSLKQELERTKSYTTLEQTLTDLNEQLRASEEQLKQLENLKESYRNLQQETRTKDENIEALKEEKQELEEELKSLRKLKDASSGMEKLKMKNTILQKNIEELKNNINNTDSKMKIIEEKNKSLASENEVLQLKQIQSKNEMDDLKGKNEKLELELKLVTEEKNLLSLRDETNVKNQSEEIASLLERLNNSQQKVAELNTKLTSMTEEREQLINKLGQFEAENAKQLLELHEKIELSNKMARDFELLLLKFDNFEALTATEENDTTLDALRSENTTLVVELNRVQQLMDNNQRQLEALTQSKELIEQQLNQLVINSEKRIQEFTKRESNLKEQLSKERIEKTRYMDHIKTIEETMFNMSRETRELNERLGELTLTQKQKDVTDVDKKLELRLNNILADNEKLKEELSQVHSMFQEILHTEPSFHMVETKRPQKIKMPSIIHAYSNAGIGLSNKSKIFEMCVLERVNDIKPGKLVYAKDRSKANVIFHYSSSPDIFINQEDGKINIHIVLVNKDTFGGKIFETTESNQYIFYVTNFGEFANDELSKIFNDSSLNMLIQELTGVATVA